MTRTDTTSWRGVRSEILRRITAGAWKPGEAVPNEADLAAELGCARGTVNRAMRDLAEDGILVRRRKAGTHVALNRVQRATLKIPVAREEVGARGAAYRQNLVCRETDGAPAAVAAWFGIEPGAQLLHLQTLHLADDRPFMFEDRWVDPDVVPRILDVDFADISVNEWLVQNVPLSKGEIRFSAEKASAVEARFLNTGLDAAVFVVERATRNQKGPVTVVRLVYAPGYVMETTI